MKNVIYTATQNYFPFLKVAIKSLLLNNPDVDNIFVLTEGTDTLKYDDFPPAWNKKLKVVDLNNEPDYFIHDTPTYQNSWFHHIVLVRLSLTKLSALKDIHTALYLDVDTVVCKPLDELFNLDVSDHPIAMVKEKRNPTCGKEPYFNSGVDIFNFDYIREHQLDDKMIGRANSGKFYQYPDQDIINEVCYGQILEIPRCYNEFLTTQMTHDPSIVHYAGDSNWYSGASCPRAEWYDKYAAEVIPVKYFAQKK